MGGRTAGGRVGRSGGCKNMPGLIGALTILVLDLMLRAGRGTVQIRPCTGLSVFWALPPIDGLSGGRFMTQLKHKQTYLLPDLGPL